MCVTLHDARLGQTTIAGWRVPELRTHCLLYGNEPENRAGVPNAMILHIPLAHGATLTQDNFLPTAGLEHVLADMWRAAPKYRELRETRGVYGSAVTKGSVSVFDMGAYTWVVANRADAGMIAAALETVRPDRRAHVSEQLIAFYRRTWPDDALAIGCFSRADGSATEPVGLAYPPQDWRRLRFPAVDAHGEVPDLRARVTVNHRIIVGTTELGLGGTVRFREFGSMDARLARVLFAGASRVVGAELLDIPMRNGDFYVDFGEFGRDDARTGELWRANGAELDGRADGIPVLLG
jgi:hypothetical protein